MATDYGYHETCGTLFPACDRGQIDKWTFLLAYRERQQSLRVIEGN